jgi:hypothetical protein
MKWRASRAPAVGKTIGAFTRLGDSIVDDSTDIRWLFYRDKITGYIDNKIPTEQ